MDVCASQYKIKETLVILEQRQKVRLERMRQFGACWLGLELWRRLELDHFFEARLDQSALMSSGTAVNRSATRP